MSSLQTIVYRIEQLHELDNTDQIRLLIQEPTQESTQKIEKELHLWLNGIASIFAMLSLNPAAESATDLRRRLNTLMNRLDKCISEIIEQEADTGMLKEQEYKSLYLLLGGCRGVSEAVITFAAAADTIDWDQWHEEVFS